jgi:WXXGXW repeat (2 copies)
VARIVVTAMAVALLALTSGIASTEWSNDSAASHGAFPKYEDPWQHWGKPRHKPLYVNPSYPNHYFVWVEGYWWWNGEQWLWVPGYWRVW